MSCKLERVCSDRVKKCRLCRGPIPRLERCVGLMNLILPKGPPAIFFHEACFAEAVEALPDGA